MNLCLFSHAVNYANKFDIVNKIRSLFINNNLFTHLLLFSNGVFWWVIYQVRSSQVLLP